MNQRRRNDDLNKPLLEIDLESVPAGLAEQQRKKTLAGQLRPRRSGAHGQLGWIRRRGRWWVWSYRDSPDENGHRAERSRKIGLLEEIDYDEARAIADGLADEFLPLAGATCKWGKWCDRYLTVYVPMLRRSSRPVIASVIRKHLRPAFKRSTLSGIRTAAIQTWIGRMVDAGGSPDSIWHRYSVLLKMLRAAKGEGLAVAIPAARTIELPRADRVESAPPRAMPLDQVQHVLREAPEPLKTVLMLCGACHLRIGEALGLRASDLDLEAGRFTVMRQRSREGITRPKTRASAGERELPVEMIEHLRRYTRINGTGDGFLFRSPRVPGAPVHDTTTRKELNSLLRRLGYKEPRRAFHAFRHAFATLAATRGVSIHVLQKEMGHADRRSTDAYIDVDQTTARAELAEVRSAFFQGLDGRDDDRVVPLRKRNDRKQRKRE